MPARLVAVGLLTLGYILGTHWLMTSAPPSPWNAVALLTPMLGAAALAARQARQHGRVALALAAIAGLCTAAALGVRIPAPRLYLAQHVAVNLALGCWFGGTLKNDGPALITSLAAQVHERLTPAMVRYTRELTRLWVAFFFGTAAASVAAYLLLSFEHWAEFSNLVCPALIGAMFVGERLLRYRLHPDFERASLADQIRAYMRHSDARAADVRKTVA